jgi:mannan endo-1,4-beta-mannosidase
LRLLRLAIAALALIAATAIAVRAGLRDESTDAVAPVTDVYQVLPAQPDSYLGVYVPDPNRLYSGPVSFTQVTGVSPGIVMYYSGWQQPFRVSFARLAARHGAVPLVQMDPGSVSLAAIASGRYDSYLSAFAEAVRSFRGAVILSFGHEMNGSWYSWGYKHTTTAAFIAAWRHIVVLFRAAGAENVTWMWTVNIIHADRHDDIPNPGPWWPGSAYVTWVGIDGYYLQPSLRFTSLFGPTITAIRELTADPILVSETGASGASQQAQIADLFSGVSTYGLLGFVWFDAVGAEDWRIQSPGAIAVLRQLAAGHERPSP